MTQLITTPEAAGNEMATQLLNIMNANAAEDVLASMDKLENLVPAVERVVAVEQLEETLKASGAETTAPAVIEAELYAAKKEIKNLSDVQKAAIFDARKATQVRKVELQELIKSLTAQLRVAQRREQDTNKIVKTVDRAQRREEKAVEEAQKAAARQARRDTKALEEAEKAEARKVREDARAMKRQLALNSAAARTAAALVREQAAAAALAALAQPAKKVRVPRAEKVETPTE